MLMHSPSTPTTISVRFLFLIPLKLHTPVAWMRPLVEPTGLDSEAKVKGAPISLSDDIVTAVGIMCGARSKSAAGAVLVGGRPCNFREKSKSGSRLPHLWLWLWLWLTLCGFRLAPPRSGPLPL